ncbi:hypothetical protein DUI87_11172 [Hirundo rustica rustica]|uniref:Uncharacterized protein n=1 Tax=Hirundo rustica rustica TaxID=333673 RepID=A0A3M0KFN6_HIRRU|nr:hypothetical protein DUI87_11172 [Hirundo rustica rustica]
MSSLPPPSSASAPSEKSPVLPIAPENCTLPLDADENIPMSGGEALSGSGHDGTTTALSPAHVAEEGYQLLRFPLAESCFYHCVGGKELAENCFHALLAQVERGLPSPEGS